MKLAREHSRDTSGPPEQAVHGQRPPASAARRAARLGIPVAAGAGTAALATAWLARR
jgi:hypothetical protein